MNDIRIKEEYLPQRCEICHQKDKFISSLNYCSRCNGLYIFLSKVLTKVIRRQYNLEQNSEIINRVRYSKFERIIIAILGIFSLTISYVLINNFDPHHSFNTIYILFFVIFSFISFY